MQHLKPYFFLQRRQPGECLLIAPALELRVWVCEPGFAGVPLVVKNARYDEIARIADKVQPPVCAG